MRKKLPPIQKKEYYGNILVLAPNGMKLCTIDTKRADWYLSRKLAVVEPPPSEDYNGQIRLRFNPKGMPTNGAHLTPKNTCCVVCGSKKDLSLHHIIPKCIRRHFPLEQKSKNRQWCVLLCQEHHDAIERINSKIILADGSMQREQAEIKKEIKPLNQADRARNILTNLYHLNCLEQLPEQRLQELLTQAKWQFEDLKAGHQAPIGWRSTKNSKRRFGAQFIKNHGGFEVVKELFKQTLLQLDPKFLPEDVFMDLKSQPYLESLPKH